MRSDVFAARVAGGGQLHAHAAQLPRPRAVPSDRDDGLCSSSAPFHASTASVSLTARGMVQAGARLSRSGSPEAYRRNSRASSQERATSPENTGTPYRRRYQLEPAPMEMEVEPVFFLPCSVVEPVLWSQCFFLVFAVCGLRLVPSCLGHALWRAHCSDAAVLCGVCLMRPRS